MSWFNSKIYSEEEVHRKSLFELPCDCQPGENVFLHLMESGTVMRTIPCIIAAATINGVGEVKYDLFFKICDGMYCRMTDFKGWITKPGEIVDENGQLIPPEELQKNLEAKQKEETKPVLKLVSSNDKKE